MQSRTTQKQGRMGWKVVVVIVIFCAGVGVWRNFPAAAEIYKWQDAQGVVYYSNKPPAGDNVRVLDIISLPVLKDAEGKAYYLKAPGGMPVGKVGAEAEFTISEAQLKELFPQPLTAISQAGTSPGIDLSALTMRLAELENQLTREAETRVKWQTDYAQAQSVISGLEQQNALLKSSVARMDQDIATLRGAMIASDIQISALKMPAPNQEIAMLTGQVTDMQTSVGVLKQDLDYLHGAGVIEQLAALSATVHTLQQQEVASLTGQVTDMQTSVGALEQEVEYLQGVGVVDQLAALSATVQTLQAQQQAEFDRGEQFKQQQAQFEAMLKKNELMERVILQQTSLLDVQDEKIQAIKSKLAQLQQPVGQVAAVETGMQGGIAVTPKIERRRPSTASRFLIWLTTPQETVAE